MAKLRKQGAAEEPQAKEAEAPKFVLDDSRPMIVSDKVPEIRTGSDKPIAYHDTRPKMKVFMASAGLLLHNELKRQQEAGEVKQFGHLMLEDVLIKPDMLAEVPDTPKTRKALEDGWIIYVGR